MTAVQPQVTRFFQANFQPSFGAKTKHTSLHISNIEQAKNKIPMNNANIIIPITKVTSTQNNVRFDKNIESYVNPFDYTFIETNIKNSELKLVQKEVDSKQTYVWRCLICTKDYEEKGALLDHYETHKKISDQLEDNNISDDKEVNIDCPLCKSQFNNQLSYIWHIDRHRPKEYFCDLCKKNYKNNYYLSLHMTKHSVNPDTMICVVCKNFSTKDSLDLEAHINTEHVKNVFYCQECDQNFISETWFNDHKVFHLDKKVQCGICNVFYPNQSFFIAHMRKSHNINVDEKIVKYKCIECDWTFPGKKYLTSHNRTLHAQANSFLCNVCGRGYPFQGPLTQHMKIHGEPKYVCSTCGKKFKKSYYLAMHLRTHNGVKPNKCHICGKCFTQKATLNVHLRTHSGERPYPCGKCKNGFITKTIRDTHQKSCKK